MDKFEKELRLCLYSLSCTESKCNQIVNILKDRYISKEEVNNALHWFKTAEDYQIKGFKKELKLNGKEK